MTGTNRRIVEPGPIGNPYLHEQEPSRGPGPVWDTLTNYWHYITWALAFVDLVIVLPFIAWILSLKKESTSAIAWCLLVILLPLFGALLFVLFGYQNVSRPLKRKRQHRLRFRSKPSTLPVEAATPSEAPVAGYEGLGQLAARLG